MNHLKIHFTRHAKQRMKLYNIGEDLVKTIIDSDEPQKNSDDKIVYIAHAGNFPYPVKVICKIEKETLIIISCYPLKRSNKI